MLIDISRYVNVIDSKRHVEKILFDQADAFARFSSSSGVNHLIPSRLTRYLNLSSDRALVNRSANWYSVLTKNNLTIPFSSLFLYEVISDIDVLDTGVLDWIARDGYGCL
ncbi:hypothetical protein Tco_1550232 [Tanacetum coccineum]